MAASAEANDPGDMAPMRPTRGFRALGWLVCQLIEVPSTDDLDEATLNAYFAEWAERDHEAAHGPRQTPPQ